MMTKLAMFTALALAACTAGEAPGSATLYDCRGTPIGTKDLETGVYKFTSGQTVTESQLEPGPDADVDVCTMESYATLHCWIMKERYSGGYAECSGCCSDLGHNTWSCWESCRDLVF